MEKILLPILAISTLVISGCAEQGKQKVQTTGAGGSACIQVVANAISPEGKCEQFKTPVQRAKRLQIHGQLRRC